MVMYSCCETVQGKGLAIEKSGDGHGDAKLRIKKE